ncbi:MAG: hypothetical protein OEM67_01065 [Thermoleophilia bacterium]|nr:hypothetical protein [Thermoleophilia bacterium]MDH3725768.1 hypothetical protein [Thermoleophilia bacterium]
MRAALVLGAAVTALAGLPASASAGTSVLYDAEGPVKEIVRGGLSGPKGALHQAPARRVLGRRYRVSKISGRELQGRSAASIASLLKSHIRRCTIRGSDHACSSHLVFVDEITAAFNDRKGPRYGANLTAAMRMLRQQSPYGGTWASRVHLYMAPNFTSSIAKGRGRDHNLGRDGRPHFATWSRVLPGLALAGGVWLEMYHARSGRITPFTRAEWRNGGKDVWSLLERRGGRLSRLHFMMSRAASRPVGAPASCGGGMACQWKLADTGSVNRRILDNGVGAYRVGSQARAWLRQHKHRVR